MARIIGQEMIAQAITFDGRHVRVSELTYDAAPLGAKSDKGYAVDVAGNASGPAVTVGFESKGDAMRFLSSAKKETYKGTDLSGSPVETERVGLGIPKAMIGGYTEDDDVRVVARVEGEPAATPAPVPTAEEADVKPHTTATPRPAIETITPPAETVTTTGGGVDPAADSNPSTTPASGTQVAQAAAASSSSKSKKS